MAQQLRQSMYYFFSLSMLIVYIQAEQFFRGRFHQDQSLYQNNAHVYTVRNSQEAMKQLEKYGYLKCRIGRRKRQAPFPGVISESQGSHSRMGVTQGTVVSEEPYMDTVCNKTQLRQGIERYQNKYQLNLTGVLDLNTLKFMSNSRCGNKDSEEDLISLDAKTDETVPNHSKPIGEQNRHKRSENSVIENAPGITNTRLWRRSAGDSNLMKTLFPRNPKNQALLRRQEMMREYIDNLYKDDRVVSEGSPEEEQAAKRKKRSIVVNNRTGTAQMFQKKTVKWRLLNSGQSTKIPLQDQKATIDLAFRMWSEVIPLKFKEDTNSNIRNIDIEIAFGRGHHQNCPQLFDGNGGEVAHSWHVGNMHFDDEENYQSINTYSEDGLYLLKVAVHEIGHVLGLAHTNKSYSIMYAIYHKHFTQQPEFELGWEDRKEVQKIYGVCKGSFNIVFDWVRKRANNQFIYNTYFFRGNRYWMYENHANRTRFGDPLFIPSEWSTLPGNLDGYIHMWYYSGRLKGVINEAYFFKGEHYYKYDSNLDRVITGWPRLIRTDFPAKNSSFEAIPANIDTAFFDMRDKNIYFFKGSKVYVFDPKEPDESRGCCVTIKDIREQFPAKPGHRPLPNNLDSVYYSYKDFSMYFIKGEDVWRNTIFQPRDSQARNLVEYDDKWYHKWYDICDWVSESDLQDV